MLKRTFAIVLSAAFLTATIAVPFGPAAAEMVKKKEEPKKEEAKKKELTPQQQKMKDCAAKWKDEKATKKVSGGKAYREFMSKCLKG